MENWEHMKKMPVVAYHKGGSLAGDDYPKGWYIFDGVAVTPCKIRFREVEGNCIDTSGSDVNLSLDIDAALAAKE